MLRMRKKTSEQFFGLLNSSKLLQKCCKHEKYRSVLMAVWRCYHQKYELFALNFRLLCIDMCDENYLYEWQNHRHRPQPTTE